MKRFEYADEGIGGREILILVPSVVIGVGILTFPKNLAAVTIGADGWISILIGGIIAVLLTWAVAKMAASFPGQSFINYATLIVSRPVAIVLTFLFAVIASQMAVLQVRQIGEMSKQYMFDKTPLEIVSLIFFLVVIYGVSGSRVGLFRLNMMFFPIIFSVSVVLLLFNLNQIEFEHHLLPVFQTGFRGHVKGVGDLITSYVGISVLWFYIALVKQPKKAPKMAAMGMCIPVGLYLFLYVLTIGVFGNEVTTNLIYPTIELAKVVEIPGEFFERFESIFFVVWIMAIFNTTALTFDTAVFAFTSIFKQVSKIKIIFILSPLVYLAAMLPQDIVQVATLGRVIGFTAFLYTMFVVTFLFVIAKIRGVKHVG